jgi:hypothetical protein
VDYILRPAILLLLIVLTSTASSNATVQKQSSIQVGAWGDDASVGSLGLRAEIRTHSYDSYPTVFDYFWVGANLDNGGFIQFGYGLEPGVHCLQGSTILGRFTCTGSSEMILDSDARWQWQYWPDIQGTDSYFEIGAAGSGGENGTWHQYSVIPNAGNGWSFLLDGYGVANLAAPPSTAKEPIMMVAEKTTASGFVGDLGPVEFRNLAYLTGTQWQPVASIAALNVCSAELACDAIPNAGVTLVSANDIIAGSRAQNHKDGTLLWTIGYVTLNVQVHPQTQFYVTSTYGAQLFRGNATMKLPKNMFAFVSLLDSNTLAAGVPGLFGAVDHFKGWRGDAVSQNFSVRLLMNGDKSVWANWATDYSVPEMVGALLGAIFLIAIILLKRRAASASTSAL